MRIDYELITQNHQGITPEVPGAGRILLSGGDDLGQLFIRCR